MMVVHVLRGHCPLFADFTEVVELQKEAWNLDLPPKKNKRIIMHDNTDVPLARTPKDPDFQ